MYDTRVYAVIWIFELTKQSLTICFNTMSTNCKQKVQSKKLSTKYYVYCLLFNF